MTEQRRRGTRRRWLRPLRLALPVLVALVALAPLSAAVLPGGVAVADTPTAPIHVTLATLRPIAPQPGDTLVLTGTLTNVSDEAVSDLGLDLELGSPLISRGTFDDYAADPDGVLSGLTLVSSAAAVESTLTPHAEEPFRISLDLDQDELERLGLPTNGQTAPWQVRELGVAVTGEANLSTQTVGQLRTFLPWAPRQGIGVGYPTRVAWIWPLVDRPHRASSSIWFDDALAPELTGNGRLAALLDAGAAAQGQRSPGRNPRTRNVPVTWAIDPMLVGDVQAMVAGYRVATTSGTTPGIGTAVAKSWLHALDTAVNHTDASVIALPYADPDIVAAIRAGLSIAIGLATADGTSLLQRALGNVNWLQYGWPIDGLADQHAINEMSATDDSTMILSDTAVPPVDGPPAVTPSAHFDLTTSDGPVSTILTDPGLSTDVNSGVDDPDGSRVSLQRFLAETLMIQAQQPGVQRDVVVAPDRRWDPSPSYAAALLSDTGKVPWIQPVSLESVAQGPVYTAVQRYPLKYPDSARRDELAPSYLARVARVRSDIDAFNAILPDSSPTIPSYTTAEQQALSSAWRQQPEIAGAELSALGTAVGAQMRQVRIATAPRSYVTLTSHGGKVPVTIANNLSTPVRVDVQLEANQRLSLSHHGRVDVPIIPPHQQTVVNVHAAAKTSGVFGVEVQLLTPGGQNYGSPVHLYVRSTVYGTITLVITGAATAALLVAVAIRLTRRALVARRSSAGSEA